MLIAGKYTARVSAFRAGMHTKKDTGEEFPKVELDFEILGPPSAQGEHITHTLYFSPRGRPDLNIKALETCGWDGEDPEELKGLGLTEVELVVEDRQYNGKSYPNVKWINRPRAGGMSHHEMGEEQRAGFGAQMRALLGRPAAPPPAAGPKADDPF